MEYFEGFIAVLLSLALVGVLIGLLVIGEWGAAILWGGFWGCIAAKAVWDWRRRKVEI